MPEVRVIVCPYDSGVRESGMGLGAAELARAAELRERVAAAGWGYAIEAVADPDLARPELARTFELARDLARRVRAAREAQAFPLVIAGNCNSALGTASGLRAGRGVVWFDAHADFDTPDDNLSGFFDVMGLAILTGHGWRALRETIPGFAAVAERDVVLAGVRDLEPYQRERLARSAIRVVSGRVPAVAFKRQLEALASRVDSAYLHIDLDVLDLSAGRLNRYAAPGGPSVAGLTARLHDVFARLRVEGAAMSAYDPSYDDAGAARASALAVAIALIGEVTGPSRR